MDNRRADNGTPEERLQARVAYASERLANAERIGRPGHIARCRARHDGARARAKGVQG